MKAWKHTSSRTSSFHLCVHLQIELFGKVFEPGEFDRMSPTEQQDKSDEMMILIQRWREERRAENLKKNKKKN